ncbi:hypothetical protein ES705_50105 [subsurface metagenome]
MQKIRSVLIPEIGIDLEPEFLQEANVDSDFIRALAHVVGRTGDRSIMIRATSDGRLMVAAASTAMEIYVVEAGAAPDAFNAGSTFEQENAVYTTDLLIETNDATISFRNAAGVWGDDMAVPVGYFSKDLIHYGVRIQNRVGASVSAYEITTYR